MQTISQLLNIQIPKGTPNPGENTALDLSRPFDIIVFIILPILIVILFLIWRQRRRRK
ncbi:adenylosuccinate synthetase [Winogradskyella pacifica]|uniref:adenylosuccinate synthetase n=1 Tax=Winogradskyella pacifica TaxID=664642 RepID=UPI000E272B6D|nr:adenylosuccinate synthetase [Winogradskyella pacifica]